MSTSETFESIDLAAAMGAYNGVSTQCISIYIPNKDRNRREIGTQ